MKYRVLKELHHDGKDYVAGDEVDLEGELADVLLFQGVIVDPETKPRKEKPLSTLP